LAIRGNLAKIFYFKWPGKVTISPLLHSLLQKTPEGGMSVSELCQHLRDKGPPTFLILFCLPAMIPIPGPSALFGLLLCLIGLRMAMGKELWLPAWCLRLKISRTMLLSMTSKIEWLEGLSKRFVKQRLTFLASSTSLWRLHGLLVIVLGLLLPLPIPMTNVILAFPILFLSLGLLEKDGLLILIAYLLPLVGGLIFTTCLEMVYAGLLQLF
jgi:hypothetical protein